MKLRMPIGAADLIRFADVFVAPATPLPRPKRRRRWSARQWAKPARSWTMRPRSRAYPERSVKRGGSAP